MTRSEAAAILGVNLTTLQSYCYGQRRCPPEIRDRIILEMGGDPVILLGPDADACPHCGRAW